MIRKPLTIRSLILVLCALAPSIVSAAAARGVLSASSNDHAWVVLPGAEHRAILLHIPGDALSGTVKRVPNVLTQPVAIGAHDDALLLAYEGERNKNERAYSIRRLRTVTIAGADHPGYSRPMALPPLVVGGELVDLEQFDDAIWALVRVGDRTIAYSLPPASQEWAAVELPGQIERAPSVFFPIGSGEPRVAARSSDIAPSIWVWRDAWELENTIDASWRVVYASGSSFTINESADGALSVRSTLAPGAPPIATIDLGGASPGDVAVATLAGRIVLLWETENTSGGSASLAGPLHTVVVSTSAGILFDAPARTAPPVTTRQLEVLAFVVFSVAFAVGVFVLHPIRGNDSVVNLPPASSLAPPSRRIFAVMFDAMPALFIASWIWGKPLDELLSVELVLSNDAGIRPLLTAGVIMIVHSAVSEAVWGRTLGKWMTGCRTVSRRGGRPTLRVAFLRNTMKVLCPPVVFMSILNPGLPWPGSFGTYVIIPPPDSQDEQRDSGRSGDDTDGD